TAPRLATDRPTPRRPRNDLHPWSALPVVVASLEGLHRPAHPAGSAESILPLVRAYPDGGDDLCPLHAARRLCWDALRRKSDAWTIHPALHDACARGRRATGGEAALWLWALPPPAGALAKA